MTTDEASAPPINLAGVYLRLALAAVIVVVLDQATKQIALETLDTPVDLIPGVLTLRLAFNPGGAFGIFANLPGLFLVATILVIVLILVWAKRLDEPKWAIPLGMIVGGGLGNVFDRIFRDLGGRVVDFIDLQVWPIFNLADTAIVTGVAILVLFGFRSES